MKKRNFDSLNRSPKYMEDGLNLSGTAINNYLKSALFKNSFGFSSYHKKCEEEKNIEKKNKLQKVLLIRKGIKINTVFHIK